MLRVNRKAIFPIEQDLSKLSYTNLMYSGGKVSETQNILLYSNYQSLSEI